MCLQGVTIPSQRRFVEYYERLVHSNFSYEPRLLLLHAIKFETVPMFNGGTSSEYLLAHRLCSTCNGIVSVNTEYVNSEACIPINAHDLWSVALPLAPPNLHCCELLNCACAVPAQVSCSVASVRWYS